LIVALNPPFFKEFWKEVEKMSNRSRLPRPAWAIEVLKKLVDLDMNQRELAAALGRDYTITSNVLSGYRMAPHIKDEILVYVGLPELRDENREFEKQE
jgi:hypothetical protein